jgi:hypothetical protein
MTLRLRISLGLIFLLTGCASERHFTADSLWPFGNPNAPVGQSEMRSRALGQDAAITPIAPQAGNVWPGPVQPVPTISQEQKDMNLPLGSAYTPSLPSPYPPGAEPPPDADLGSGPLGGQGSGPLGGQGSDPLGAPGTQNFSIPAGATPSVVPNYPAPAN